ncbi:hypothetical protein BDA96_08G183700 [Sorghum bicolor]|uniref:Uncharacterized protein n=2 Tax=Sorghum bicolor TaxID=4558 RepID=A0A921QH86_SORBI|nr:hypothetical protein SORBI_3008G166200 [Sorghum bicolor]KAG0521702.1 hypothetical protein BDA96_08G183700 [Sorghum bicolor]
MAIAPAYSSLHDEEEQMQIMSLTNLHMVENDDDAGLEKDLKALRASVAALQDEDDDVLPAESWDWAEGVEAVAQRAAEVMARELEDIQRALSSSSVLPGEEEEAAALRAEARRVGALRADAEEIAAAARRLMETDLRRLAADAETGSYSYILTHEEMAVAARMDVVAVAAHMEEWMASLAARLNRGAAAFAATPGEEAFVAAMRMEAAKADDARSVLAWYRAGGGPLPSSAGDGAGAGAAGQALLPSQAIDPSISIRHR